MYFTLPVVLQIFDDRNKVAESKAKRAAQQRAEQRQWCCVHVCECFQALHARRPVQSQASIRVMLNVTQKVRQRGKGGKRQSRGSGTACMGTARQAMMLPLCAWLQPCWMLMCADPCTSIPGSAMTSIEASTALNVYLHTILTTALDIPAAARSPPLPILPPPFLIALCMLLAPSHGPLESI